MVTRVWNAFSSKWQPVEELSPKQVTDAGVELLKASPTTPQFNPDELRQRWVAPPQESPEAVARRASDETASGCPECCPGCPGCPELSRAVPPAALWLAPPRTQAHGVLGRLLGPE